VSKPKDNGSSPQAAPSAESTDGAPPKKKRVRRGRRGGRGRTKKSIEGQAPPPAELPTEPRHAPPVRTPEPAEARTAPVQQPAPSTIPPRSAAAAAPPRDAPVVARRSTVPPPTDAGSARLRALEERLGELTRAPALPVEELPPPSIREAVSVRAREVVDRLAAPVVRAEEAKVVDTVKDLLSSAYYLRKWGRLGMRNRSEEVDDFGLDGVYEERLRPLTEFLYERYFRVTATGLTNVPALGRCLVVANHSGTLPLDGLMLRTCVRREHAATRELRWLAEDSVFHLPFVGAFMSRVGGVRACPENAERLLAKESLVAVFPEGVKGIGKLFRERYRLQRFGRGGFIRLCLRTRTPLVPCAIVGAEEASPMLYRDELVSKLLGFPYLPVTPTFPLLGPLGLVPAPTKWSIEFGEIFRFDEYGPEAAADDVLVGRLADRVRASIQNMIDRALAGRRSVWFG
jgi:1-acyl-sn-glycerol-3-phosphate acyltransferase